MSLITSIRAKVLLAVLIPGAVVLAAVALLALYSYERVARDVVLQRDTELARISAARLSEGLNRHIRLLQDTAAQDDVQSMEPYLVKSALETAQDRLYVFYDSFAVYGADGPALATYPDAVTRPPADLSLAPEFDRLRRSLRPAFSDIYVDPVSGEDVIRLSVPILGTANEFRGVLAGVSNIKTSLLGATFSEILELKPGRSGFVYLVDGNGRVIYHRHSSRLGADLSATDAVTRATTGEPGAVLTNDLDGETVVSGFAAVPRTGWAVITQERWENVAGPIRDNSTLVLGLFVLGGVFAAGMFVAATGRILRPIRALTRGAQRIADGDFDHTITARTGDEIQDLAQQFNSMAVALKESYAGLEQKVEERTEELRESNQALEALINASPLPIIAMDGDAKVRMWNPAAEETFGWTEHEIVGRSLEVLVSEEEREQAGAQMGRAVAGEVLMGLEVRRQRKDGSPVDVGIWTAPLRDADGEITTVMGIMTDLTDHKRAEQTMRELVVLDERNRMAREIHDTLAQGFTGIVLQLEAAEQAMDGSPAEVGDHLGRAKNLARDSLQEARRSVWDLLPKALEGRPLDEALEEQVDQFASADREQAYFNLSGEKRELPTAVQTALLRICQESLTNIRRHAGATEVRVDLNLERNWAQLEVHDNGRGFDFGEVRTSDTRGGFGLAGMEQRARLLGGTFEVKSRNGTGTVVEVKIPIS